MNHLVLYLYLACRRWSWEGTHMTVEYIPSMNMLEREMASAIFALPSTTRYCRRLQGTAQCIHLNNSMNLRKLKLKLSSLQSEQIYMCFFSNCFTGNKIYQFFNSNLFVSIFFLYRLKIHCCTLFIIVFFHRYVHTFGLNYILTDQSLSISPYCIPQISFQTRIVKSPAG
jgi:hypothetical protein